MATLSTRLICEGGKEGWDPGAYWGPGLTPCTLGLGSVTAEKIFFLADAEASRTRGGAPQEWTLPVHSDALTGFHLPGQDWLRNLGSHV